MIPTQKTFRFLASMMIVFILIVLAMGMARPVHAQGAEPYVIRSTKPISDELRDNLNMWLVPGRRRSVFHIPPINTKTPRSQLGASQR